MPNVTAIASDWVAQLDPPRCRELFRLLARNEIGQAERALGNVLCQRVSLSDDDLREAVMDELERRMAPDQPDDADVTTLFPTADVGDRDLREEDLTEEASRR